MDASYLRVKNWHKFQHYSKRRPAWIKSYAGLLLDDRFVELSECERGQLMTIWLVASQSSRFTVDEEAHKVVPVVTADEKALRIAIRGSKRIPLERFIRDGWLIPVAEAELVDEEVARVVQDSLFGKHSASALLANGYQDASPLEQRFRGKKDQVLYRSA